ncbi:hypothetical protein LCGC14_0834120 [marine sediment metagenome]|uniref:AP2/ERF domain-containing protein n=1 Tax=marine sediment metagenome TaxID=412755 RepID=A0A0F9SMH2_9ZZZZ
MPVQACRSNNKPGFKWGKSGFCYTYTAGNTLSRNRARNKAKKQGSAIKASQSRR